MCGIIGCIGSFNSKETILKGLELLEYRGYDSSGLSYVCDNKINITKVPSSISKLKEVVTPFKSNIAIGHTRWATHGKISLNNTHPFLSYNKLFSLVHNGTIDNFEELKRTLMNEGYLFEGDTDSEVIVNYLEYLYLNNKDILKSLNELDKVLKGSYSLVINSSIENSLFFLKNQTSLIICKDKDGYLISSDVYAFDREKVSVYEIENHQYGIINETVEIYKDGVREDINYSDIYVKKEDLNNVSCYLEKEINEAPEVLKNEIDFYLKDNKLNIDKDIINRLKKSSKIVILGCGSSYHAGLIFKRLLLNKYDVDIILASEFIYDDYLYNDNATYIVISQSGETLDIISSMDKIKNAFIISITNNKTSTIAKRATYNLDIMVNKEISVASTKAYLGEIVLLYLLYCSLTNKDYDSIKALPYYLNITLQRKDEIKEIAKFIKNHKNIYFLGKGIDYDVALECSLKLKEITYLHSEALYAGELKHGPLALVDKDFPVIIINSDKRYRKALSTCGMEIVSRGGRVTCFENIDSYPLNFIIQVYFGELLALYVGEELNVNIDKPRNLAKSVTVE